MGRAELSRLCALSLLALANCEGVIASGGTGTGTTGGLETTCGLGCSAALTGLGDQQRCATNADCNCPLTCTDDPLLGKICSACCQTGQDCANPFASCQDGNCRVNLCAGDAGPYYALCDAGSSLDGTCVPEPVDADGNLVGICYQSGSAVTGAPCDPQATRADLAETCVAGDLCGPDPKGPTCRQGCDPTSTEEHCPASQACLSPEFAGGVAQQGICDAPGPGGCNTIAAPTRFMPCTANSSCPCPELCFFDPGEGINICENPCGSDASSCDDSRTVCADGGCAPDYCEKDVLGNAAPGRYGMPCNAAGMDDGFCTPYALDGVGGAGFGLCQQSGTSPTDGNCDPGASRSDGPAAFCVPDDFCDLLSGGVCVASCLYGSDGGDRCGSEMSCLSYVEWMGVCAPCSPGAGPCAADGDCCGGSCDLDAGGFCR